MRDYGALSAVGEAAVRDGVAVKSKVRSCHRSPPVVCGHSSGTRAVCALCGVVSVLMNKSGC